MAFSAPEKLQRPVDGQLLDDIHELAAAVVAPAGVAFGIFIGEDGALSSQDRGARVVLRGDHLQPLLLAPAFVLNRLPNLGVGLLEYVHRLTVP